MKINFRGKTLNIKNQYNSRIEFLTHFEMYTIEIEKWKETKEWSYTIGYEDQILHGDNVETKNYTLTQVVQLCFDEIDEDIKETEEYIANTLTNLKKLSQYRECKCPYCGSKKIFKFRLDSDWATGSGDYGPVNEDQYYTKEELQYDSFDRPDIEIYHCGDCGEFFS